MYFSKRGNTRDEYGPEFWSKKKYASKLKKIFKFDKTSFFNSILTYYYILLCILLYITVDYCILLYTTVYYCILLYTTVYYCRLLYLGTPRS